MERSLIYNGTITAEQFLFYEIRIASKYYLSGTSVEDAIEKIKKNNLFQYPTERLVARMVRSCYKRLDALDDEQLRQELSSAPTEIAKQINLYAMMRYNRIVWDFMIGLIGEKFRSQDFEFSRKDLNVFFSHLQEQNDDIAGWSESTVNKIKQVLTKALVETRFLTPLNRHGSIRCSFAKSWKKASAEITISKHSQLLTVLDRRLWHERHQAKVG